MNTTLSLLLFNILEAALSLTHQLTHHFFDCNSLSNLIKLSALIKRSQQGCVFKFKSRGTTMLPPPGLWEHLQFCCEEEKQVTLLSDANEQLFQTRASTKEIKIPVSSFRAGIYYIQVESQSEGVVKKQLVIKR